MQEDLSNKLHEPRRSFWALWIIVSVMIAFGIFWYTQTQKESRISAAPIQNNSLSVDSLQAAVINSEVPDFSEEF